MPNYLFGVAAFFFAAAFSGAAFCGAPVSAFFAPLGFGLLAGVDDCLGPGEDSAPFAFGGDPGEDSPPFAFAVGEDSAPFALEEDLLAFQTMFAEEEEKQLFAPTRIRSFLWA